MEAGYEVSFDGCELFLRDCAACVAQARAATDGRPGGRATRLLSVLDRDGNSHVFAAMLALTDVRTGRPTVVAAVRAWRALCAAKGARFPRSGRITLAAASIFARALMAGDTELSPSSLVSYLFAVRRFARFAFDEADDPMSDKHSAIKLIVARMNRMAEPKFDARIPFGPSTIMAAASDPYTDLAIRTVCAIAWDGLCRLGSLLEEACPAGRRALQIQALTLHEGSSWPAYSVTIQDKMSPKGERVTVSADPASAFYNPASCGSPFLVREYVRTRARRGPGPAWLTKTGLAVTKRMVTELVTRHRRDGHPTTGHAFRISGATWLYTSRKASVIRIASLGRWHNPASVVSYIRENAPFLLREEDATGGRHHF